MADEIIPPEPTAADIAKARPPEPLTRSEKETFEACIDELREENRVLKEKIFALENPPSPEPKKDGLRSWLPKYG